MNKPPVITQDLPLSSLRPGQKGLITGIQDNNPDAIRLVELGFIPGEQVEVLMEAPLGDPVEVRIMGYLLCLRKKEASLVQVQLISLDTH